jgi:hypothetical protein
LRNHGRREREAGKRHRRATLFYSDGAKGVSLKLGSKHLRRFLRQEIVADLERQSGESKEHSRQAPHKSPFTILRFYKGGVKR